MKLILCPNCLDVQALRDVPRICACGRSGGNYRPGTHEIEVRGEALVLGASNEDLRAAIKARRRDAAPTRKLDLLLLSSGAKRVIRDPADPDELPTECNDPIPGQEWLVALGGPMPSRFKEVKK